MSLYGAFAKENHLSELDDPLWTQQGVIAPASRRALVLANLFVSGDSASVAADVAISGQVDFTDLVTQTYSSASTSGSTSIEPFRSDMTMTGAGGVGGRAHFALTIESALGGWSNALKGSVVYDGGKTSGLGSAVLAEMTMDAGNVDGTYAPLEIELNMPANAVTGTQTSLIYASVNGADVNTFGANGFAFSFNGLQDASGKVFDQISATAVGATARLRININGDTWYIPLSAAESIDDS